MIYMSPQSSITQNVSTKIWGQICTPTRWGSSIDNGRTWCMDNGVFSGQFNAHAFWQKLKKMRPYQASCVFVVAPDVVANALATLDAFRYWGARIQAEGWPVAFVAQDGQEHHSLPPAWAYDALFIGGSTEWKMSQHALDLIAQAKALGKWVHVGRVNSQKRIAHFQLANVDSVDGTAVCFAPSRESKKLKRQLVKRPLFTL